MVKPSRDTHLGLEVMGVSARFGQVHVVIEVDRKRTSVDLESKGPADYVESIISTWSDCG